MSDSYYGLIASLPYLPRDLSLSRLPISRQALKLRLKALSLTDQEQINAIIEFHQQLYRITELNDQQVMQLLEDTARKLQDVKISALFQQEVNLLLVVSALRQRQQGKTPVLPIGGLGVGGHIRRYWNQPDFNLGGRFPWLGELRELLEQGRVLELERQIDQIRWKFADSASQMNPFTFEAVVAYVGKWDILYRWSQTGEAAGLQRFNELIDQVLEKA